MSRPIVLPIGHERFAVLALGRRVAAALAAEALDIAARSAMASRVALATLSLAVEAEAARRAGGESRTAEVIPALSAALARVEREAFPHPFRAAPGGRLNTRPISMLTSELLKWTIVSGLAAALLRWPGPHSPFWSLATGRPFVVTRQRQGATGRFREAAPA